MAANQGSADGTDEALEINYPFRVTFNPPLLGVVVKCVLFDKNDNVLVVDEQYVDAPFAEVIIRVPGAASDKVESVRCYGLH